MNSEDYQIHRIPNSYWSLYWLEYKKQPIYMDSYSMCMKMQEVHAKLIGDPEITLNTWDELFMCQAFHLSLHHDYRKSEYKEAMTICMLLLKMNLPINLKNYPTLISLATLPEYKIVRWNNYDERIEALVAERNFQEIVHMQSDITKCLDKVYQAGPNIHNP